MDRGNDTTDAYVEIKLGNVTHKTDVKRKTLNPTFNSQWFRFEIDDQEVQDEFIDFRVMVRVFRFSHVRLYLQNIDF